MDNDDNKDNEDKEDNDNNPVNGDNLIKTKDNEDKGDNRAARIARLPRSLLDPESFPHTAYVKILATLARKIVN